MQLLAALPVFQRDLSRQLVPQVLDLLRAAILALALPPGTVLQRAELAQHWGVSQTPVRDALLRLGEEGLVDIFAQHATVVSRIDIDAALQAHFLRRALESELVHELAQRPLAERQTLCERLLGEVARQARAKAAGDNDAFLRADLAFHQALFQAGAKDALWTLLRQRSGHVDRLRRLNLPATGKAAAVLRDHRAIVQALQAGRPAQAQAAVRAHLAGTLAFVEAVRARHPQWVAGTA